MANHTENGGDKGKSRGLAASIVFVLSYFASRALLEADGAGDLYRVAAALLPVVPFAWMLWEIFKGIRGMDELEQRIQLEALALAFPLALLLLMTLGLLEIAVKLPPEDLGYRHVWAMMPALYLAGLARARRRYR